MKTKLNFLTILALLLMLVGGNVTAAHAEDLPVLEQLPNGMFHLPSDSGLWDAAVCTGGMMPCSGAEDVVVQVGTTLTISRIELWGFYFGDPYTYTDDFTVVIHQQDEFGGPGTAIYTENHVNSLRAPTGVILGDTTEEFLFTLTLATPQALEAGVYWIEIYNTGGTLTAEGEPENVFGWETGNADTLGLGAPGLAAWYTEWLFHPDFNLSLRLIGSITTPTTYSISGAVFNDENGNGIWDAEESGLDGAYVWVDPGCDGEPTWTVPVTQDGSYSVDGLPEGICFAISGGHDSPYTHTGWKETTPPVIFDPLSADQTGVIIGLQEYTLTFSPDTLPDGQLNQPYSQTITVSDGVTPYTFHVGSEGNLPGNGLDVSTDANAGSITISGTPTAADKYYLYLYVTDAKGIEQEVQRDFFIKTDPALTITSSLNPSLQGQEVTFSLGSIATVSGWPAPWGQVTFYADGAAISGCEGLWLEHNGDTGDVAPNPITCTTSSLAVGSHTITASLTIVYGPYNDSTATLAGGQTVNGSEPQYQSAGFGAPLDLGNVLNTAKAGQMIPLKWRLLDASGNPVLNLDPASVTLTVNSYACQAGVPTDAIETYAAGTSALQNLGDGYYQLNWKTDKTWVNSCKQITLKIGDWSGDGFTALFQFKK